MTTLLNRITRLRDEAVAFAAREPRVAALGGSQKLSAINLLHYLSLRRQDLREIQQQLIERGLTSLGILEAHTLSTLNQVIGWLRLAEHLPVEVSPPTTLDVSSSSELLHSRVRELFGDVPAGREVRIMVTMPSEAAGQPELVESLLHAGMNVMRINCAHDDAKAWLEMIDHLRSANKQSGQSCKVQIDLAGPKLRTGILKATGRVKKLKPTRNILGEIRQPARVWLVPEGCCLVESDVPTLETEGAGQSLVRIDDEIVMHDARGAKRRFRVVAIDGNACLLESDKTCYAVDGAILKLKRKGKSLGQLKLVNVQEAVEPIQLSVGEALILSRDTYAGTHAEYDEDGHLLSPARIHCTLPEAFDFVQVNQSVWFDDGKIGGVVHANDGHTIEVQITHTPPGGGKLRSGKGINFPDTVLHSNSLTAKDLDDLALMIEHVDMIALSFVQSAEDVAALQRYLDTLGRPDIGIVVKIETRAAFENLPEILLQALHSPRIGVMIARGDLAVEVGFRRLSEIQEEIIWLCEAAHIPVIWATQILEGLVKTGAPSRAEITDAAASIRAECAMLNKGPNLVESVAFLDRLLHNMETHYHKRRLMMRPLRVCFTEAERR